MDIGVFSGFLPDKDSLTEVNLFLSFLAICFTAKVIVKMMFLNFFQCFCIYIGKDSAIRYLYWHT